MRLTASQLKQMVTGITHADHWIEAFDQLLPDYEINTPNGSLHLLHNALMSLVILGS